MTWPGRLAYVPSTRHASRWTPMARFVRWHNTERPHMSLNTDVKETPEMAFGRKTPPPGSDITDE